ncbi:hemogen-like [Chionomys nivalis]|uniref:hemogen-like n=1 Tax=Chionomys nivalis TaxID=269649 RepID=UPI00259A78AD|nr:hemogen-like [Chionomys nivalis]
MDLGKEQSYMKHFQTPDSHAKETHAPDVIGSWCLRNREQLKKRKDEAQKKLMVQWHLGEQKKNKRRRSRKVNQRGQKRQQDLEEKPKALLQIEEETQVASAQKETQNSGMEALTYLGSSPKNVSEEYYLETHQESLTCGEDLACYQDISVWNDFSETDQYLTGDLYPKLCQEIAELQEHSSIVCDMTEPEALSLKTCEETMFPKTPTCNISEDTTESPQCSASKSDVLEDSPNNTCQKSQGPDKFIFEPDSETTMTEGFFTHLEEIAMSKDVSPKAQESVGPQYLSHEIYKEITAHYGLIQGTSLTKEHSFETCQDICVAEKYSYEAYHKLPGNEDHSAETCKNID